MNREGYGWYATDSGDAEFYCPCTGACKCHMAAPRDAYARWANERERKDSAYWCDVCQEEHEGPACEEEAS